MKTPLCTRGYTGGSMQSPRGESRGAEPSPSAGRREFRYPPTPSSPAGCVEFPGAQAVLARQPARQPSALPASSARASAKAVARPADLAGPQYRSVTCRFLARVAAALESGKPAPRPPLTRTNVCVHAFRQINGARRVRPSTRGGFVWSAPAGRLHGSPGAWAEEGRDEPPGDPATERRTACIAGGRKQRAREAARNTRTPPEHGEA